MNPLSHRPGISHRGARWLSRSFLKTALWFSLAWAPFVASIGCRAKASTKPPLMLVRDMHDQLHLRPQSQLPGVSNGASVRTLPLGVVARESPAEPGVFELGKSKSGYLPLVPMAVDGQLLARGEERFNIYCSICHDRAGRGQGVNPLRGFPGPIDLASDGTRAMKDGQLFEIITQGIRNMPPMGDQVPVADRWPIVAWVRVLQRSQHAKLSEVEPMLVSSILPEEAN